MFKLLSMILQLAESSKLSKWRLFEVWAKNENRFKAAYLRTKLLLHNLIENNNIANLK